MAETENSARFRCKSQGAAHGRCVGGAIQEDSGGIPGGMPAQR